MATKNMGYDNPAYLAVHQDVSSISGSGGNTKFVAFTNMIVKSVTLKPTTAGTSNDISSFIQISGTTTTTTALATFGSGVATFTNVALATQPILAQGDTYYVVKGTDATAVISASIERVIQPLANVTA